MRRRRNRFGGKRRTKPVRLKSYRNGGMGQGVKSLVHKGEMIVRNPFGN